MRQWFRQLSFVQTLIFIALVLTVSVTVVLAALAWVEPWLWLGWLYGASAILLSYAVRLVILKQLLKLRHGKWLVFLLGALSLYLSLVWVASLFLVLIIVNNIYANLAPLSLSLASLANGPLNFFSFLAGISVLLFTIVLGSIVFKVREQKWSSLPTGF